MKVRLILLVGFPVFGIGYFYYMSLNLHKRIHGFVRHATKMRLLRIGVSICLGLYILYLTNNKSISYFQSALGSMFYIFIGILILAIIINIRSWYFAWQRYAMPEPDPDAPAKPHLPWRQRIMAGRPRTVFQWLVFIWAFICVMGSLFVVIKNVI